MPIEPRSLYGSPFTAIQLEFGVQVQRVKQSLVVVATDERADPLLPASGLHMFGLAHLVSIPLR